LSALVGALVAAHADLHNIAHSKRNEFLNTGFSTLADVCDVVRPALAAHGLVITQDVSWQTEPTGSTIVCVAQLLHVSGDARTYKKILPVSADERGNRGLIQEQIVGRAETYARRRQLLEICCLASDEGDIDDAHVAEQDNNNFSEAIKTLCRNNKVKQRAVAEHLKITSLEKLTATQFAAAKRYVDEKTEAGSSDNEAGESGVA
jgi:hypothetical protein